MKRLNTSSTTAQTLRIFWRYNMRYKVFFWIGTIGAIIAVITQGVIPPLVIAKTLAVMQKAFVAHTPLTFSMFLPYFLIFAISMALGVIFWRVQSYCIWELESGVAQDLAQDLFDNLQHQSQRFHADHFGGALVSQVTKFTGAIERLTDDFIWSIIPSATTMLVSLFVLVFVSPAYALVLLVISVIYLFVMSKRVRVQLPYNTREAELQSDQTAALADAITNIGTIRAFAAEDYEYKYFGKATAKLRDARHTLSKEVFKTETLSHFQTNGFSVVAFLFGLIAVTTFHANISILYLVLTYTQAIVSQLLQFGRIIRNVNRSLGDAAAMTEISQLVPEVTNIANPEPARINRGGIEFNDVTFLYPENKKPLFNNLNLRIKPGEKIGLVGQSGGGKTTITGLVLRFMDIKDGVISIDGQDIAKVRQEDLRKHISYVSQEPILFHRSLMDNIRYGDQQATDKMVKAVAKLANADEFIQQLPDKYDTLVGERGVKLSGGQRQRIAIARAMLKNAPILLLDEATSALDSESEVLIQDALWKLMEGRTAIVIAHRLSTIQKMDRIVVLDKGKIVEQGTHKELLNAKGNYASLWSHQSGGFLED